MTTVPTPQERAHIQAVTVCGVISRALIDLQAKDGMERGDFKELVFCGSDVALGCVKSLVDFLSPTSAPLMVKAQLCASVFSSPNARHLKDLLNRHTPQKMASLRPGFEQLSGPDKSAARAQALAQAWVDSALPKMSATLKQMGYEVG